MGPHVLCGSAMPLCVTFALSGLWELLFHPNYEPQRGRAAKSFHSPDLGQQISRKKLQTTNENARHTQILSKKFKNSAHSAVSLCLYLGGGDLYLSALRCAACECNGDRGSSIESPSHGLDSSNCRYKPNRTILYRTILHHAILCHNTCVSKIFKRSAVAIKNKFYAQALTADGAKNKQIINKIYVTAHSGCSLGPKILDFFQ